jgi:hypothetical protein
MKPTEEQRVHRALQAVVSATKLTEGFPPDKDDTDVKHIHLARDRLRRADILLRLWLESKTPGWDDEEGEEFDITTDEDDAPEDARG